MQVGTGKYRYRLVEGWANGPQGRKLGVISGLAVDSHDRLYVVDREPKPAIVVFDRDGRCLTSWGEALFPLPHGIWIGPDDRVYVADCRDHTIRICTPDGEVLQMLGTPGQVGAPGVPFNMPTRAVRSPWGDIYVSDGYGQHHVHRFSPDGTLVQTWGGKGSAPGQFTLPHGIVCDRRGRVLVADREPNNRIQAFDANGSFLSEWPGLLYPCDLYIDQDDTVFVGEGGGARISIYSLDGELLDRFGEKGTGPGQFIHGPHALTLDSHGDLYLAEVGGEDQLYKFARVR